MARGDMYCIICLNKGLCEPDGRGKLVLWEEHGPCKFCLGEVRAGLLNMEHFSWVLAVEEKTQLRGREFTVDGEDSAWCIQNPASNPVCFEFRICSEKLKGKPLEKG